jgi:6-phosphogluconolactonase
MGKPKNVSVFETSEQLALAAAQRVAVYQQAFHAQRERFSLVLAGGNTPRRVYELLATPPFKQQLEWDEVDLFFGDERCVPPDHRDSNYAMAYQALIFNVPIPPQNVYRMAGEESPEQGAWLYESQLQAYFPDSVWPRFGLVLLGLGTDGHTASLFPGSAALNEAERWVLPAISAVPPRERLTLTVPVFNHATHVLFLVSGTEKAERLAQVLNSKSQTDPLPAQLIKPRSGSVEWLVDSAAAALL